jgi:FkbM family methyltransferase
MNAELEFRYSKRHAGQWLWPIKDTAAWRHLNKKTFFDFPQKVAALSTDKTLIVQAGGNCGIFPKQYSALFDTVITFEPDALHFACLSVNVTESNVFKFQACLGDSNGSCGLDFNAGLGLHNWGAKRTVPYGLIPQIALDSLNLIPDVVHLDIEGYEGPALEGMANTIKTHHPLIVLETNDFGDAYGWPQCRIDNLLASWGYQICQIWGENRNDTAYVFVN